MPYGENDHSGVAGSEPPPEEHSLVAMSGEEEEEAELTTAEKARGGKLHKTIVAVVLVGVVCFLIGIGTGAIIWHRGDAHPETEPSEPLASQQLTTNDTGPATVVLLPEKPTTVDTPLTSPTTSPLQETTSSLPSSVSDQETTASTTTVDHEPLVTNASRGMLAGAESSEASSASTTPSHPAVELTSAPGAPSTSNVTTASPSETVLQTNASIISDTTLVDVTTTLGPTVASEMNATSMKGKVGADKFTTNDKLLAVTNATLSAEKLPEIPPTDPAIAEVEQNATMPSTSMRSHVHITPLSTQTPARDIQVTPVPDIADNATVAATHNHTLLA